MAAPPPKRQHIEEEEDDTKPDPVKGFVLTPSEQIHQCLQLANSPLQPGNTPQESYQVAMRWIHTTVTQTHHYIRSKNGVEEDANIQPIGQPPPGL